MKTIKENIGLVIALLITIFVAIELYNDYCKEKYTEELINSYIELIKTATNYETN